MVARDCNPSTQKVEVGEAEVEGWDIQLELSFKERRGKKKKSLAQTWESIGLCSFLKGWDVGR